MLKQFITSRQAKSANDIPKKACNLWFRMVLAVITGTAVGLVAIPLLFPALLVTSSGLAPEAYSHIVRSSAFVAYLLLWASMLAGLSITSKAGRKWPGMSWSFGLHRYTTLLGLGFAVMHVLALLGDGYMTYTLGEVLVPFMAGSYKTQWLGLGQVALYSMAIIAFSFYARNRIGVRTWRLIHSLSFALFLMALIHGLQTGSDSGSWWASALYWMSAASVLLGALYRVLAARTGRPKEKIAATGLIAVGGKAQSRQMPRVLHAQSLIDSMQPSLERVLAQE
ncbi:MAG TPA: hypothetical protein VJ183_13990 [Chloroflexia bacterium]|nr:hypothetical protein [Chloroflexia bacterium]